jgi:hypothetical protein
VERVVRFLDVAEYVDGEAYYTNTSIIPPGEDGSFPENWQQIVNFDPRLHIDEPQNREALNFTIGIDNIGAFMERNENILINNIHSSLEIEFMEGFNPVDFIYDDESLSETVPLILPKSVAEERGLNIGDNAYFIYRAMTPIRWLYIPAVVIGIHNEFITGVPGSQQAIVVPGSTLEFAVGSHNLLRTLEEQIIRRRDILGNTHLESAYENSFIIPAGPDGSFPENWQQIVNFNPRLHIGEPQNREALDFTIGILDPETFISEYYGVIVNGVYGSLEIEFLDGFDPNDFIYEDEFLLEPVPVIISKTIAEKRGLAIGDSAFFTYRVMTPIRWLHIPAVIVGIHNEFITGAPGSQQAMVVPHTVLEIAVDWRLGHTVFAFSIDPAYTRDLHYVRAWLGEIAFAFRYSFIILDEPLNNALELMNQTLVLFELLYPVITVLAIIIAFGIAVLLSLQSAKNVAIMRVLGVTKKSAVFIVCAEQFAICAVAAFLALAFLAVIGWALVSLLVILYLAATLSGTLVGSFFILKQKPLELLQMKE